MPAEKIRIVHEPNVRKIPKSRDCNEIMDDPNNDP